jgi:hypothetical protein
MAENSVAPIARGETFFAGGTADAAGAVHLEGLVHAFPDTDPADVVKRRSGGNVVCVLVRNTHSAAVLPGNVVVWKTLKFGKETGAPCSTLAERVAGVVDDHLPAAGCAINDLYWLIVRGPADVIADTGNIAEDNMVFASGTNAGRAILIASPSGTQACRQLGTGIVAITAAATGTIFVDVNGGPA